MKKGNKMNKGFTLIELITVVIIIAIMAALALPQYTRFIERSQSSTAKNAMSMIRKAQATYFALNSAYSQNLTNLETDTPEIKKLYESSEWNYTTTCVSPCDDFTTRATRIKGVYDTSYMEQRSNATVTITKVSTNDPTNIW